MVHVVLAAKDLFAVVLHRKMKHRMNTYSKRQNDIRAIEVIKKKKLLTGGKREKGPYLTEIIREIFISLAW